jgi:hypothetical protein
MIGDIKAGDTARAIEDFPLNPNLVRDVQKAIRLATRGLEKRSGQKVGHDDYEQIKLTFGEAARQAIGFRPPKLSEHYRRGQSERLVRKYWSDKKSNILRRREVAKNIFGEYSKQVDEVGKEVDQYNDERPRGIPAITSADFKRRGKMAVPKKSK